MLLINVLSRRSKWCLKNVRSYQEASSEFMNGNLIFTCPIRGHGLMVRQLKRHTETNLRNIAHLKRARFCGPIRELRQRIAQEKAL